MKRNTYALLLGVCLLAIVGIFAPELFELALSVAAFGALGVGTTITSGVTEGSTPDTHKVRDVDDILTTREPWRNPLYVALRRLRKGRAAAAEKVEWEEDDVIERATTAAGATVAGGAGGAVTVDPTDEIYLADDTLMLPDNATTAGAILHVAAVNADGTIDVVRVDGGTDTTWGTVPAIDAGEKIVRLGNNKKEFYDRSGSRTTMPEALYNYVEREEAVIEISRTRKATKNYSQDDWERSRDRQLYDYLSSREYKLFFGRRQLKKVSGKRIGFMGGILDFNLSKQLTYSAASFSEATLIDWFRQIFSDNSGSPVRYFHVDPYLAADLAQIPLDKVRRNQVESKTLQMGLTEIYVEGFGTLRVVPEHMFGLAGKQRYGTVLDYENLSLHDLNPMSTVLLDLKKTQGTDGMALQVSEEATIKVRYEKTHAEIVGSA